MTPPIIELIIASLLGLFGLVAFFRGLSVWCTLRRNLHPRSVSSASSVGTTKRDATASYARLDGILHAIEPVVAFDGSAAVAIQRTIRFEHTVGDTTQSSPRQWATLHSAFEVRSAEGSTTVELDSFNIIGPYREYVLSAAAFQASHPSLWADLPEEHRQAIRRLFVSETVALDGARGFVVGEVVVRETSDEGDRSSARGTRYAVRGRPMRPVVLSGWDDKTASSKVLAPASGLVWLALLAWTIAALAVAVPWYLAS
jgi:hypothetical protein